LSKRGINRITTPAMIEMIGDRWVWMLIMVSSFRLGEVANASRASTRESNSRFP
jgi:hypothetical protein